MKRKLLSCDSLGETPQGEPCVEYVRGYCKQAEFCTYQSEEPPEKKVHKAEHVLIPDRIAKLLADIAAGNIELDDAFVNSDTYRAMYRAAQVCATYDPDASEYDKTKLDDPYKLKEDGAHLSALNVRLSQAASFLQADSERVKSFLKELEAKKAVEVERSLRCGLRPGGYSEPKVRMLVQADDQVAIARDAYLQSKKRSLMLDAMCVRIESMVNMIKKCMEDLRRDKGY